MSFTFLLFRLLKPFLFMELPIVSSCYIAHPVLGAGDPETMVPAP